MKRTLFVLIAAIGLASAANAATLVMTGPTQVNLGETFDITMTANSQGDVGGFQVFVVVNYDQALIASANGGASGTFTQFGGGLPATVGGNQGSCAWAVGRDDQCLVFDQILNASGSGVDAGDVVGTFSFTAGGAPGFATFNFQDAVGSDFVFFGLGNQSDTGTAPVGWTVEIVPEPTTGALLGLGLFGLALGGRRRR